MPAVFNGRAACAALTAYLVDSGYWAGERRSSHTFVLSPDVCVLTTVEQAELEQLAIGVRQFLCALEQTVALAAETNAEGTLCRNQASWQLFRKFLAAGVPRHFADVQLRYMGLFAGELRTPAVKLDVVRTQKGFRLIEVDGWNPRAAAFTPILHRLLEQLLPYSDLPSVKTYPGVVPVLSHQSDRSLSSLLIILSQTEAYYVSAYEALAAALCERGVCVDLVTETDLDAADEVRRLETEPGRMLYALPSMPRTNKDRLFLASAAALQSCLFPPKPFWSSKGLLVLISEPPQWVQTVMQESACFSEETWQQLARQTARTWFPTAEDAWPVMKSVQSSGCHGVFLPPSEKENDPYFSMYACAARGGGTAFDTVFQERLRIQHRAYRFFGPDGRLHKASDFRERFIVHIASSASVVHIHGSVLDIDVTARRHDLVHGQPDCLQFLGVRTQD